jgi:hypothetical protein
MQRYVGCLITSIVVFAAWAACHRKPPVAPSASTVGSAGAGVDGGVSSDADAGSGSSSEVAAALGGATLPQFTAARGGSLGIPSAGAVSGLTANVDAQLFADSTTANAFAQLGGLSISPRVTVDIFAQSVDQDLPRFLLTDNMVKVDMYKATLASAGMRARIHFADVLLVSSLQTPECLDALRAVLPAHDNDVIKTIAYLKNLPSQPKPSEAESKAKKNCKLNEIKGLLGATLTIGAHALRRTSSEPNGVPSNGGAAEVIGQYEWEHYAGYVGLSGVVLTHADDKAGGSTAQFPTFSTARLSGGFEYRGIDDGRGGVVPRVGVYGIASHAWWHDPYTFGTIESKIQSTELEAGVYVGGKFTDQLSGILAARALRSLGPKQDTVFILSFIPSASSSSAVPVATPAPTQQATGGK